MKANLIILSLVLSLGLWSCGDSASKASDENAESQTEQKSEQQQGPEYTSAYICPMHCEGSGSEEPGTCPVCGMDYVKNEDVE
jgi:rubrerythrin